ncbi:hypothetical protein ACFL34_02825 [Candidatus Sumerlaeota bacterium]
MNFTKRETAHILAALRLSQQDDISHMPHFEDGEEPLNDKQLDELCQRINIDAATGRPYTVVGLWPDADLTGTNLQGAAFTCIDFQPTKQQRGNYIQQPTPPLAQTPTGKHFHSCHNREGSEAGESPGLKSLDSSCHLLVVIPCQCAVKSYSRSWTEELRTDGSEASRRPNHR